MPDVNGNIIRDKQNQLLKDITIAELLITLKSTNKHSTPGPDQITYKTIANLPQIAYNILVKIYNAILDTAYFPQTFTTTITTVIPKQNMMPKDATQISSYRPISLTSSLGKLWGKCRKTPKHSDYRRQHHQVTSNSI